MLKDPFSGLSHLAGALVGSLGAVWLISRAGSSKGETASVVIYGACLVVLYLASALYHLVVTSERATRILRLIDHAAIFSMVAGTCTPVFYRGFSGRTRVVLLATIWGSAVLGIVFKLLWRSAPRALYTALYVAMGWGAALSGPTLVGSLPHGAFVFLVAGGVVYTCGAVVYALRKPDPFPRIFGFHEIWHLFVLGGSALHYVAVALIVRSAL